MVGGDVIKKHRIDTIPVEEIAEARAALAREYIDLKLALEQNGLVTWLHKRRVEARIAKLERYLVRIDEWLEEIN